MPLDLSDRGDGTYSAAFSLDTAGEYVARAWLHGAELPERATVRVLPAALDPARCDLSGEGLRRARCGERTTFTIHARDSFGNLTTLSGLEWRVQLAPAEDADADVAKAAAMAEVDVVASGDGTYVVTYLVEAVGAYRVHVSLGSAHTSEPIPPAGRAAGGAQPPTPQAGG